VRRSVEQRLILLLAAASVAFERTNNRARHDFL
jgi:hypothetical protein